MSNSIKETLQAILDEASEKIEQSDALDKLNDVRVNFLGKKGQLTSVLKSMKDVAPEDRPKVGQMVNEARAKIETMMEETKTRLEKELRSKDGSRSNRCHTACKKSKRWSSSSEYHCTGRSRKNFYRHGL